MPHNAISFVHRQTFIDPSCFALAPEPAFTMPINPVSPESPGMARLWRETLDDALKDFRDYIHAPTHTAGYDAFKDAQRWIFGEPEYMSLTFEIVCGGLRIDPQAARRSIALWAERARRATPHVRGTAKVIPLRRELYNEREVSDERQEARG